MKKYSIAVQPISMQIKRLFHKNEKIYYTTHNKHLSIYLLNFFMDLGEYLTKFSIVNINQYRFSMKHKKLYQKNYNACLFWLFCIWELYESSDFVGFLFKMHRIFIQAKDAEPINTTLIDVGRNLKLIACAGIQNMQLLWKTKIKIIIDQS